MTIYVNDWDIVSPGELLAEDEYKAGLNVYREGRRLYSMVVGLLRVNRRTLNVIPLSGHYIPKVGDIVIGEVIDLTPTSYIVDIRSPYTAILHVNEALSKPLNLYEENLRKYYDVGDYVIARVIYFEPGLNPLLSCKEKGLGKVKRGRLLVTPPSRVPRLIGRQGSMVNLIKKETGCDLIIGQNGYILVISKDLEGEAMAIKAIRMVEEEAHVSGLTTRVASLLRKEKIAPS
ncbi:MAG: exosome complex RNA-binding protein Rrp4 [Candidatus Nezhaarchaeales archaeon]